MQMTKPVESSSPVSNTMKKGQNDTSGISESNALSRPQYPQASRISKLNNVPYKRMQGTNQQQDAQPTRYV